ncbi:hypothetical protein LTR41_006866 [Exophiala xenobiotica]|nr:hypothetical protein LTR41_006866 [Exophiala xenobiotica]
MNGGVLTSAKPHEPRLSRSGPDLRLTVAKNADRFGILPPNASHDCPVADAGSILQAPPWRPSMGPPGPSSCLPVRHGRAWARGVQIFNDTLTKDKKKKILVSNESIAANATALLAPSTSFAGLPGASGNAVNPSADESAAIAPLILLVKETRSAADKCAQSKSGIHKHFERITWAFNRYAQSVDVLIQQHPDTTAIAWGVIRMLVTIAATDQNTSERLGTALSDIVDIITRCEDYQNIYPDAARLEDITSKLYAEVINFLVRAKKYYSTHGAMRVAKSTITPFEVKFGAILDKIEKLRHEVRDEVQLLTANDQAVGLENNARIYGGHAKQKWLLDQRLLQESTTQKREDDLRSIRYWLDATHFDHLRREKHWQDGTCEWIMGHSTFTHWLAEGTGPFWIQGIPGSGKTVMSTFLHQRLQSTGLPVAQFFCKKDEVSKRKPAFIVATLLSQLLDHPQLGKYQDQIAPLIMKQYNRNKDLSKVSIDALCALLESALLVLPPVLLIIDGLDECDTEDLSRSFLIGRLIHLSNSIPGVKTIVTSRLEDPFAELFESVSCLEMSKLHVSQDIEAVIRQSVEATPRLHSLKDKVISALVAGADGMFLWPELMLATLKRARNRNAIEKMLANLPVGLREVYEHILVSIGNSLSKEDLQYRRAIFSWVTTAARPMTLAELSVALAIQTGSKALDEGEIILRLENDIRELCGPMLTITEGKTVQVVHMSVRDMLHTPGTTPGSGSDNERYLINFVSEREHATLAASCLTYLAFDEFRHEKIVHRSLRSSEELLAVTQDHIMLNYTASHWIDHVCASLDSGVELQRPITDFLQSGNTYMWVQLIGALNKRHEANFSIHILQRSRLIDWAQHCSLMEDSAFKQILEDYLAQSYESGVRKLRSAYGDGDSRVLNSLFGLACLYDHEDRLQDAQAIHEKLIESASQTNDPAKRTVFENSCIELACLHRIKAEYDRSIELLHLVLDCTDSEQWTKDAQSAEAMADLGVVYRLKSDLAKAREFGERGAEGLTMTLGPSTVLTIRYVIQLCRTYFESAMYEDAKSLLEDTLRTSEEVLGPNESVTLHGRDLLGNILHKTGELDAAESLLKEVLGLMRQQWGEKGRSTCLLKRHVADVLVDKAAFGEALGLYQQAFDTLVVLLGDEHPDTLALSASIAECHRKLAQPARAEGKEASAEESRGESQHTKKVAVTPKVDMNQRPGFANQKKDVLTSSWIEVLASDASLNVKKLPPLPEEKKLAVMVDLEGVVDLEVMPVLVGC